MTISNPIREVAELALRMYEEAPYSFPIRIEDIEETLTSGVELFVEYEDDKAVGFAVGVIGTQHPIWGDTKYAAELAWYVLPEYRGAGVAKSLKKRLEAWARINDAKFIIMAAMHNDSFEQVKNMYEKTGYRLAESSFIKEIN